MYELHLLAIFSFLKREEEWQDARYSWEKDNEELQQEVTDINEKLVDVLCAVKQIRGILMDWENTYGDNVRNINKFVDLYRRIDKLIAYPADDWENKKYYKLDGSNIG
jgi:hypothetical protein